MTLKDLQKTINHASTYYLERVAASIKLDHHEQQWSDKRKIMDYYFVHRKGKWFDHCFVMVVYPQGGLRIESCWARLDIEPMAEIQSVTALETFMELGWTVEKVEVGTIPMPRFPGLGTCVSITKRVLGINKPWIITARQLARYINATRDRQIIKEEGEEGREVIQEA